MLHITTWLWGDAFSLDDVAKLEAGVGRQITQPHRFHLIAGDKILDPHLTKVKGCFARMRMFDPLWQYTMRMQEGDRIVCIDLDTVITGPLDPLFDRPEPFVIMQQGNSSNPCPYNGALSMLRYGYRPDVWSNFSLDAAAKTAFYEFPDDQGWLWHKIPDAAGWTCGKETGVYVFRKPGWPCWRDVDLEHSNDLPSGARLVTFSGKRKPAKFAHLDWVKEHWR